MSFEAVSTSAQFYWLFLKKTIPHLRPQGNVN